MNEDTLRYQVEAQDTTPKDAAQQFARNWFDEPRTVIQYGVPVADQFRLVDGTCTYEVRYVRAVRFESVALWQVWQLAKVAP